MKPHLTRREREILDVLWELAEPASAEEIRERLPNPPGYSAVRALLARLEGKGVIRHREQGLRYVYLPTAPRTTARRSALQQCRLRPVRRALSIFCGVATLSGAASARSSVFPSSSNLARSS